VRHSWGLPTPRASASEVSVLHSRSHPLYRRHELEWGCNEARAQALALRDPPRGSLRIPRGHRERQFYFWFSIRRRGEWRYRDLAEIQCLAARAPSPPTCYAMSSRFRRSPPARCGGSRNIAPSCRKNVEASGGAICDATFVLPAFIGEANVTVPAKRHPPRFRSVGRDLLC
jgi:hypothetical protein